MIVSTAFKYRGTDGWLDFQTSRSSECVTGHVGLMLVSGRL